MPSLLGHLFPGRKAVRVERIGDATLYLGDCGEILPTLPKVDAVVTDPPYEIGNSWGTKNSWQHAGIGKSRLWGERPEWDKRPAKNIIDWICERPAIIWGANYFEGLPSEKGWLVWDKCADMTQAQAELAWSNVAPTIRVFRKSPLGAFGNGGANGEQKQHPTQKPIGLIEWCLGFTSGELVLDPFMGSGTTGVACANLGRKFIGIEVESKYFDISCERIAAAYAQGRLFA